MSELIVTIRCITYNHEAYIRECLEGFVMQQTNFRFEAIVHDDASTDGTAAIVAEYAAKYPDIIKPLYETENQYSKRDGSLKRIMDAHMHGKYIAMCEGDDYWTDPHKLQKQVDFLEANPDFSMCFHNAEVISADGTGIEYAKSQFAGLKNGEYSSTQVVSSWFIPTASILYRSFINEKLPKHKYLNVGDIVLAATCCMYGRIYCINDVMSVYQVHGGGATANARMDKHFDHFIGMKQCFPKFHDIYNKTLLRLGVVIFKGELKRYNILYSLKFFIKVSKECGCFSFIKELCRWTFR